MEEVTLLLGSLTITVRGGLLGQGRQGEEGGTEPPPPPGGALKCFCASEPRFICLFACFEGWRRFRAGPVSFVARTRRAAPFSFRPASWPRFLPPSSPTAALDETT